MPRKLKPLVGVLLLGVLYFVWLKLTRISIPCVINEITGWRCPGCGITTLFYWLFQLRFKRAFRANPFIFVTLPFLIFEVIYEVVLGPQNKKWNNVLLIIYVILLVLFGVLRNIIPALVAL